MGGGRLSKRNRAAHICLNMLRCYSLLCIHRSE